MSSPMAVSSSLGAVGTVSHSQTHSNDNPRTAMTLQSNVQEQGCCQRQQVPFRLVIAVAGTFFVLVTGIGPSSLGSNLNRNVVVDVSDNLREQVTFRVAEKVKSVTGSVHNLTLRSGKGVFSDVAAGDFGCCSPMDDNAKYLSHQHRVRHFHWQNLQTNQYLLLSFSGTLAGSIILLAKTDNKEDIDGTNALNGTGNLQWTLSDASTNYSYHQYYSNTWHEGGFVLAQTSLCGRSFILNQTGSASVALASRSECEEAATSLVQAGRLSTATVVGITDPGQPPGCWHEKGTAEVTWNAAGDGDLQVISKKALCRTRSWFPRRDVFQPSCSDLWPCTEGEFVTQNVSDFNEELFSARTAPYNATQRSWYKGAVEWGSDVMNRKSPGWSKVYLSASTGQLVLPSVLPLYAGTTDTVRGVVTLGVGLEFLDMFLKDHISDIHPDAKGWIIDLSPTDGAKLIASLPPGLSTTSNVQTKISELGQTRDDTGAIKPEGQFLQAISETVLARIGENEVVSFDSSEDFDDSEYDKFLQNEFGDVLIEAKTISDEDGLDWLLVVTVPRQVFYGRLEEVRIWTIIGALSMTVVGGALLFAIAFLVSAPIRRLGAVMAQVSRMNLEVDPLLTSTKLAFSEVSSMESSFKEMSKRLKTYWQVEQEEKRKQAEDHERRQKNRIAAAIKESDELRHPMVLVPAKHFIESGKLLPYEVLRDEKKLVVLDTLERVFEFEQSHIIIFFSHQWLEWGEPDPDGVHFRTMCNAIRQLLAEMTSPSATSASDDSQQAVVDDMYIWCDYCSISQEHRGMQILAISSLPVYSSRADAFVIIAPATKHRTTRETCDLSTYDMRGWCRVETLAKMCGSGIDHMFSMQSEDGNLEPITVELFKDKLSMNVFEGTFSCCERGHTDSPYCDKEKLVQSVLGLYHHLLVNKNDTHSKFVLDFIQENPGRFFPARFIFSVKDRPREQWEERVLFGDLVQMMDALIATAQYNRAMTAQAIKEDNNNCNDGGSVPLSPHGPNGQTTPKSQPSSVVLGKSASPNMTFGQRAHTVRSLMSSNGERSVGTSSMTANMGSWGLGTRSSILGSLSGKESRFHSATRAVFSGRRSGTQTLKAHSGDMSPAEND